MNVYLSKLYRMMTGADEVHWLFVPVRTTARWMMLFYMQLKRDQAFVRASGMAYITLVAMVPLLMLMFGAMHAFGLFENGSEDVLSGPLGSLLFGTMLGDIPEVREFLLPGLLSVDLNTLGLAGVAGLVVFSARLFMMVERAYNDIFGVHIDRGFGIRLLNFYFTLTIAPLAVVLAVIGSNDLDLDIPLAAEYAPSILTFVLLLMALKAFPCTNVRWRPAIAGATVTWVLLHMGMAIFPLYLRWFASDDPLIAIYGSLGLIPVFLLWLYCLWIFVLLGVEVAYVFQNFDGLVVAELDNLERNAGILRTPSVEMAIESAVRVAWSYDHGDGPIQSEALASVCGLPLRELNQVLRVLENGEVLARCDKGGWMPARPADQIPIAEIIDLWREQTSLRKRGNDPVGDTVAEALKGLLSGTLADGLHEWVDEDKVAASNPG